MVAGSVGTGDYRAVTYFLCIAKTSYGISIIPQEVSFFHCLLLLERFSRGRSCFFGIGPQFGQFL